MTFDTDDSDPDSANPELPCILVGKFQQKLNEAIRLTDQLDEKMGRARFAAALDVNQVTVWRWKTNQFAGKNEEAIDQLLMKLRALYAQLHTIPDHIAHTFFKPFKVTILYTDENKPIWWYLRMIEDASGQLISADDATAFRGRKALQNLLEGWKAVREANPELAPNLLAARGLVERLLGDIPAACKSYAEASRQASNPVVKWQYAMSWEFMQAMLHWQQYHMLQKPTKEETIDLDEDLRLLHACITKEAPEGTSIALLRMQFDQTLTLESMLDEKDLFEGISLLVVDGDRGIYGKKMDAIDAIEKLIQANEGEAMVNAQRWWPNLKKLMLDS